MKWLRVWERVHFLSFLFNFFAIMNVKWNIIAQQYVDIFICSGIHSVWDITREYTRNHWTWTWDIGQIHNVQWSIKCVVISSIRNKKYKLLFCLLVPRFGSPHSANVWPEQQVEIRPVSSSYVETSSHQVVCTRVAIALVHNYTHTFVRVSLKSLGKPRIFSEFLAYHSPL